MKVEVEINFSLNGWIFILLVFYCSLYALISLFKDKTVSLFTKRAIQLQIYDLYLQINQNQSLPQPQSNIEKCLQVRNLNKELFKYIDWFREKIIQNLGKTWQGNEAGDSLMVFLQQNDFFKKFYSVRVFYKDYLDFLMQKYHFLSRVIKSRGGEWIIELQSLTQYLIFQLSFLLLINYFVYLRQGQDAISKLDFNIIFICFLTNQIIVSPISILFSSCEYLISSKATQFYKTLYVSLQTDSLEGDNNNNQFKPILSRELASIFSKLFDILNIILLSLSFFQLGITYVYDQSNISQFFQILIMHLTITIYELIFGRFASCLFIGIMNIFFREKEKLIQSFIANYLQKFFQSKLNQKDKKLYSQYYSKTYEEYLQIINGQTIQTNQFIKKPNQYLSLNTINQHPNIEIINTACATKQYDSLPTQQASLSNIMPHKYSKLLSAHSKNIPSSFQLKQLTANKTYTDYENTYPGTFTRQESQIPTETKENVHFTSATQIEESQIKDEEIFDSKQIKNFQNQCCDLLNKNYLQSNSYFSDKNPHKYNSFSCIASIENQMSINLLPLQDLEFPGLPKKSSNFLPLIQSYSTDGTQINIQRNSQFSVLNQTVLSSSSISSHMNKQQQQQIQRTSIQKMRKSSNYSSQRSQNSIPKVNQNNILSGNEIEFRDLQIKRLSSEENTKKNRTCELQSQINDNKVFIEKEQQLIDFVEFRKRMFLEEHQKAQQQQNQELFFCSQKTIDHAKRKSSNMSNFIDYCDYKEMFQSYKNVIYRFHFNIKKYYQLYEKNFNSQEESQKLESSLFTN